MKRLLVLLPLVGCSQILGLDDTRFEQHDAHVDAPSSCDGAPRCISTTGRSVCGQLFRTGDAGGQPMRVAAPTGMRCAELGSTEGPCALSIFGQAKTSYFTAVGTDRVAGEIDDCGRFVIPDLDASVADVAVVAKGGTDYIESAALLLGRMTTAGGTDKGLDLPIVSAVTEMGWATQLDPGTSPDVIGGYLVTYVNSSGIAISGEELRVNGGAVNKPPALPWGAYFSGAMPFGTIGPTLTTTQDSGTAAVVPSGSFMLGGFRQGRTCTQVPLQPVSGAVIHVTLSC